jgi:type III secretion protein V
MNLQRLLKNVSGNPDMVLAVAVAGIVAALIAPVPPWLLDVLIATNIAAGCSLLVASLYAKEALKVAAFPTLLLITTLFRLSLNVSATKLALSDAHAGAVIQAVGEFVVGGNYVVGAVVFAILTLVQFMVVAKGAERVAEVAARFTLDAMPGKQMSIDADLRAGAIDQAEARRRRRAIERESQMYGAMDGAMKFVKGDAIAGIVIVLVNSLGGLCIGVLAKDMDVGLAARTYALLAIGDGLVSQIPSLCVAISAGFVVTRVSGETEASTLGGDIWSQIFGQPKALWVVAALLIGLGLVPGMPILTFGALAIAAAIGAHRLGRAQTQRAAERDRQAHASGEDPASSPAPTGTPQTGKPGAAPVGVAPICLDLGPTIESIAQEDGGRFVSQDLPAVRDQIFQELGVRVPGVRVRTGATYLGSGYALLIDEVPCARGEVELGVAYAMQPPSELGFLGFKPKEVIDPVKGGAIAKLSEGDAAKAKAAGVEVKSPRELIAAHVRAVIVQHASAFIGVQETQALLDGLDASYPALVREATQKVPVTLISEVLRRLVEEGVSIRNLRAILECFAEPGVEGDGLALAERARRSLRRQISYRFSGAGPLYAYLCDPEIENTMRKGIEKGLNGIPALDPDDAMAIINGVREALDGAKSAVVLAGPEIRRYLRKLCEGTFPDVAVLTYGELMENLNVKPIGKIAMVREAA